MSSTSIELPEPPAAVLRVLEALAAAGGRGYVVGGAVRDLLSGGHPEDFDLVTDLEPDVVAGALPHRELREQVFGTVSVVVDEREVTVTTLREERGYSDARHPDHVAFVRDIARDAPRRDFTINALYWDPLRSELHDPLGGRADLAARTLRVIGDAEQRLAEDPLRLLRLVRFAAALELRVDPAAEAAARAVARRVRKLSAERVYDELTRAFTGPGRGRALRLFVESGLADELLPEVSAMNGVPQPPEYHPEGDVLTHVCLVLQHCPPGDPVLAWSAVLHDIGKPPTFREAEDRIRFDGHDNLSAEMAEGVLRRLRAPRQLRAQVVDICRQHIRFAALPQMRPVRAERWLRSEGFEQHLAFHRADCMGSHQKLEIYEFARRRLAELPPVCEPLLSGRDVLELGVAPGPQVGKLLRIVDERLAEDPVPATRQRALVLLRDVVDSTRQGPGSDAR